MRILFLTMILSVQAFICSADVYLIFDDSTKEIYSISDRDDAVMKVGQSKVVLIGSTEDYPKEIQDYKYENKSFKLNTKKMNDKEIEKSIVDEQSKELELIRKASLKSAYETLKAEGVKFKHVKDSDFE